MKFEFNIKVGENEIKVSEDADTHTEFFEKASFFMDFPKACGHCGKHDLVLDYRNPSGYDYYSIKCNDCGYHLDYGQLKEPAGTLFKKDWQAPYEGEGGSEGETKAPAKKKSGGLGSKGKKAAAKPAPEPEAEATPAPAPTATAAPPAPAPANNGGSSSLDDVMARYGLK